MGKRTAQKDITINTTSDSQVNSNFPNRWSPASLTFSNYFYLVLYFIYKIRPLNILSASSVNLHGITNSCVFHNNLRIRLSPLKSPILRKYTNPFKRCGMYPSISKCNAKMCKCCKHLSTKTTVTSSVNGIQFSVINNLDLD